MRHLEGAHPGLDGIARRMSRSVAIPLTMIFRGRRRIYRRDPKQRNLSSDNRRA
jgi:hypothetical protein